MRFAGTVVCLWLLGAGTVFAVDGAVLSGGCAEEQGNLECRSFLLCDSDTAASTCSEFNLGTGQAQGYPSYFTVTLLHTTGCSSGATIEVEVRGAHVSDTDEITISTSNLQTDAVQSQTFDTEHKFIDAVLTGTFTSCSDIDVAIILFYER